MIASAILALTAGAQQLKPSSFSPDGNSLEVSLITASPGRRALEWLGHSGIEVANIATGERRYYEYGAMSSGVDAIAPALTGRLYAHASVMPSSVAMRRFADAGRAVHVQRLALTSDQKIEVVKLLDRDIRRGRRLQRYRIVSDNCATRARDIIDAALGHELWAVRLRKSGATLRENALLLPMPPPVKLGMDFVFNAQVDKNTTLWDAAALPLKLDELVANSTTHDESGAAVPLVSRSWSIGESDDVTTWTPNTIDLLTTGLCIALLLAIIQIPAGPARATRGIVAHLSLSIPLSILAAGLTMSWLFTGYEFTYYNANLLLANPVIVAIPIAIASVDRPSWHVSALWTIALCFSLAGASIALISPHAQDNLRFAALFIPPVLAQTVMSWINLPSRRDQPLPEVIHQSQLGAVDAINGC